MVSSDEQSIPSGVSRRKLLAGSAAGIVTGIAGCSSDDPEDPSGNGNGDGNGNGNGNGNGTTNDATFVNGGWGVPTDFQFNPFNISNFPIEEANVLYDQFAEWNENTQEFEPALAEDWEIDGDTMTVNLRDQSWHNGDQITAHDIVVQLRLAEYEGDPVWDILDSVEEADESTVEFTLSGELNPIVARRYILPLQIDAPARIFESYLEDIESAGGGDAEDEAVGELLDFAPTEPTGSGPYQISNVTGDRSELTVYEDHPWAGDIEVPNYHFTLADDNQTRWSALISEEVDGYGSTYVPPDTVAELPDSVREINFYQYADYALAFNFEDEVFGDRRVRQAIAHILNREDVALNVGPETREPIEVMTGTSPFATEEFLPSDVVDSLNRYEQDHERAAELLREAGFEQDGDTWVDENGDPLRAPIKQDSGLSDYISGTQTVVSQLDSFGIEAEMETVGGVSLGSQIEQGDFRMHGDSWGHWNENYPFFDYNRTFASVEMTQWRNIPEEIEVPMPVGEPDGDEETVNPRQLVNDLSMATEESEQQEILGQLAWIYNQYLPKIQFSERNDQTWINEDGWDVPDSDEDAMGVRFPSFWAVKTGAITPE